MAGVVIRNAEWIVTVDGERRILRNGAIAIKEDRISSVGKHGHLPEACADEACADMQTIDAAGLLVLPGFVDTHVHNTQHLGRGLADECDIPKQLLETLYGYESA